MTITSADLRRMQDRLATKTGNTGAPPSVGIDRESDLHADVESELIHRGWLYFHGSMARKTYRTAGEPDFIICAPGGRLIMVECKARNEKQETAQLGVALHAERLGHKVWVVRNFREFLNVCDAKGLK